jgi:hypothetical protein
MKLAVPYAVPLLGLVLWRLAPEDGRKRVKS